MKKKTVMVLLGLAMVLSLALVGCADNAPDSGPAAAPPAATEAAADTGETQTVDAGGDADDALPFVEVHWYFPSGDIIDMQVVQDEINVILEEKFNAHLIFNPTDWAVYGDRISLMLAAGEAVDMVYDATFLGWLQNVGRNSYLAVDDLLERYGQDILATTHPINLEAAKVNGVSFGVCADKDLTQDIGFWFAQEFADIIGLTAEEAESIHYLEDMEPLLERAVELLPAGVSPIFVSISQVPNFTWALGATREGAAEGLRNQTEMYLFRDDWLVLNYATGEITPVYEFPSFLSQAELIRSWYQRGFINADAATTQMTWQEPYIAGTSMTNVGTITPMHHGFQENTGIPTMREPIVVKPGVITGEFGGPCIPVSAPNPERAMMIINEFHANVDIMNMWTYGVEGIHFTMYSENVIEPTDRFHDYSPGTFWMLGSWFGGPHNSIFTTTAEDPLTYSNLQEFNRTRFAIPIVGFNFDTEPVRTEIAAHRDLMTRFMASIANGVVEPGPAIEQMRAEHQALGIDRIIEEYERQYRVFMGWE